MPATTARIVGPLGPRDTRWEQALCARIDPDLHHPASAHHHHSQQVADARQVCARCPLGALNGPCLARALEAERGEPIHTREGIYAGTTPRERFHIDMEKENA